MPHPVVCFVVSVGLVWLWAACRIIGSVIFLFHSWFGIRHLALELAGVWMRTGLSVLDGGLWERFHELMFYRVRSSLVFRHPRLEYFTSDIQAHPLNGVSRLYKPNNTEEEEKEIEKDVELDLESYLKRRMLSAGTRFPKEKGKGMTSRVTDLMSDRSSPEDEWVRGEMEKSLLLEPEKMAV